MPKRPVLPQEIKTEERREAIDTEPTVVPVVPVVPSNLESVQMRLAINPFDLERLDKLFIQKLLKGKVDPRRTVWVDKNDTKETGLILLCDFLAAATICDLIRSEDRRVSQHPSRVYLHKQKEEKVVGEYKWTWRKIPFNSLLTIVRDEVVILNPEVFGAVLTREKVNANAPRTKKIL